MPSLSDIKSQHTFTVQLYELVHTSQEISIMQMQKVRSQALATRNYMDGLRDVFYDVRSSYEKPVQEMLTKSDDKTIKDIEARGKRPGLAIFLSTDERFSGTIIPEVFELFAEEVKKRQSEIVVIGKIGKELYDQHLSQFPYTYVEVNINDPDRNQLAKLMGLFANYSRIDIFSGRYVSLVNQEPAVVNISGNATMRSEPDQKAAESQLRRFLFEPSLQNILQFFEAQITTTLFRLSLYESQLANLGSRINSLESSISSVEKQLEMLDRKKSLLIKSRNNKKQQQRIAGSALWN